ncbi:MAG TPA: hypothetical protein VF710_20545, partial [Longimicrobium sp.]
MAAARSWRLSGANGWGAGLSAGRPVPVEAAAEGVLAGRVALTLRPAAGGPLDPATLPATAGGLTLPANVALAGGALLLASARRGRVLRWDAARQAFASWVGLPGIAPGDAPVLDAVGELLAVGAVGSARVAALHPGGGLVFDDAVLPGGHRLRDLIALPGGVVLVLSVRPGAGGAAVWAWRPGWEGMAPRARIAPRPGLDATRLLADAGGRVHVLDAAGSRLLALRDDGSAAGEWIAADDARERFAPL